MKNDNHIQNRLNELFASAKQQQPLIGKENVRTLIQNAPATAFPGKQLANYVKLHLKTIMMTTIVSSILVTVILWLPNPQHEAVSVQSDSIHESLAVSVPLAEKRMLSKKDFFTMATDTSDSTRNLDNYKQVAPKGNEISIKSLGTTSDMTPIQKDNSTAPVWGGDNFLELTLDEFCRLGLKRKDSTYYSYYNLSPDSILTEFSLKANFFKNGTGFGYYRFNNLDFALEDQKIHTRNDYFPVFETLSFINEPVLIVKNKKNFTVSKELKFDIMNDTLVPITIVSFDSNSKAEVKTSDFFNKYVYWFTATESFYKALPDRYREKTKSFYEQIKNIKKKMSSEQNLVSYYSSDFISQAKKIELDMTELERLGFRFTNEALKYDNELPARGIYLHLFFRYDGSCGVRFDPRSAPVRLNFYPEFVSTTNGTLPIAWQISGDALNGMTFGGDRTAFFKQPNRLVPVIVRKEMLKNAPFARDLIFWFYPTEAFFDSLPSRIGNDIRKEYHALEVLNNPEIAPEMKAKVSTGCTYFEECLNTPGIIKEMLAYPNPTTDLLNVEISLEKQDEVAIALFDISGRLVKYLKYYEIMPSGQSRFSFDTGNFKEGIYILSVRDRLGNQMQQRIIKQ